MTDIFYFTASSVVILKCRENFFGKSLKNFFKLDLFVFWALQVPSWNIKKKCFFRKNMSFLSFGLESTISRNIRIFFIVDFFNFPSLESTLLKFFKLGDGKFHFLKNRKFFQSGFLSFCWAWVEKCTR